MKAIVKITSSLLQAIREDLWRPHPFAYERVGFISAGLSSMGDDILILAREYMPVLDEDYLRDSSVGAMMGPSAISKAMQWSRQKHAALIHVHSHGGQGIPDFSGIDLRENAKFVPYFFNVAPHSAHGAIVLSNNAARGQIWLDPKQQPISIEAFSEIGIPIRKWGI